MSSANDWKDHAGDHQHASTRSRVSRILETLPTATVWDNTYRGIGVDIDWTHAPVLRSTLRTLGGRLILETQTRARCTISDLSITMHTQAPLLDFATKVANQLVKLDATVLDTLPASPADHLREIAGSIADAADGGRAYTFGQATTPTSRTAETLATLISDQYASTDLNVGDHWTLAFHLAASALTANLPTTAHLLEDTPTPQTDTRVNTRTAPRRAKTPPEPPRR